MPNKFYTLFILFFIYISAQAQLGKEAWHWQFGDKAALDFSSVVPVVGTSSINTVEGTASISDQNTGQVLFYTDGVVVYDKNNNLMPNGTGLFGSFTTTQSALIVPKPGSANLYYLITCDEQGGAHGVCYSIVDMSLNGGLGDVISSSKNTLLTAAPVLEKLVAVKHCNGTDYWIIDHPFNSNAFNVYLVTSAGISPIPVVSNVGTVENSTPIEGGLEAIGYLKASQNGKKLALGVQNVYDILELYDFDNTSGTVSNPITLLQNMGVYGISFSPDNSKLYCTVYETDLYQYDLSSGIDSIMIASQKLIASGNHLEALQIAPDGKIYVARFQSYYLSVINNPNLLGVACNYQDSAVNLFPNYSTIGLPNFIDANGSGNIVNTRNVVQCNAFTTDTLNANSGYNHYQWSTGDTTQSIIINTPGTYWLSATSANGCSSSTDTVKAYIINPANIQVLKDTIVCSLTGRYNTNVTCIGAQSYQWYDGSTSPIKNFSTSGTYSVNIYFPGGCVVNNTFSLTLNHKPKINFPHDTTICGGISSPIILNAGAGNGYTYNWSTGASTQTISVADTGTYWVHVSSAPTCNSADTISIKTVGPNKENYFNVFVCKPNDFPLLLSPPILPGNNNQYSWVYGSADTTEYVNYVGNYTLTIIVGDGPCAVQDIFNVRYDNTPPHISNVIYCNLPSPQIVSTATTYVNYLWSTGSTTDSTTINNAGTYWLRVTNSSGCILTDTFHAIINIPPSIHILKDTTLCLLPISSPYYHADATYPGAQSYYWYNGSSLISQNINASGYYWVDITTGGCVVRDSFHLAINSIPPKQSKNIFNICDSSITQPIILNAISGSSYTYNWSTTATTQTISVTQGGNYWVDVSSEPGCVTRDSTTIYVLGLSLHNVFDTTICNTNSYPIVLHAPLVAGSYYVWTDGTQGTIDYAYSSGTYTLYVYVNSSAPNCTITDVFNVVNGNCTGIEQVKDTDGRIVVYPNPSSSEINIEAGSALGEIVIYNCLGEIVLQTKGKSTQEQINIRKLVPGVYTIQIQNSFIKLIIE